MTEKIENALTPEEWAAKEAKRPGANKRDWTEVSLSHDGKLYLANEYSLAWARADLRHAVAALALHEMPFGFTRDDVEILRQMPSYIRGLGLGNDPDGVARFVEGLAARIAALLPPEPR